MSNVKIYVLQVAATFRTVTWGKIASTINQVGMKTSNELTRVVPILEKRHQVLNG